MIQFNLFILSKQSLDITVSRMTPCHIWANTDIWILFGIVSDFKRQAWIYPVICGQKRHRIHSAAYIRRLTSFVAIQEDHGTKDRHLLYVIHFRIAVRACFDDDLNKWEMSPLKIFVLKLSSNVRRYIRKYLFHYKQKTSQPLRL